mgnify:CR=1 FL=1
MLSSFLPFGHEIPNRISGQPAKNVKRKCITLAPCKSICLLKVSVLRVTLRSVLHTAESEIAYKASKIIACHWGGVSESECSDYWYQDLSSCLRWYFARLLYIFLSDTHFSYRKLGSGCLCQIPKFNTRQ